MEAINRGTAIIRGNTVSDVCIIDGAKFPGSCIRHLYISHNAPYLPSPPPTPPQKKKKKWHHLCFSFLLGITAVPSYFSEGEKRPPEMRLLFAG